MADTPREDITVAEAASAPKARAAVAPSPKTKIELNELVSEIWGNPEKLKEYLASIRPIDYKKTPEVQSESIAGTQAQMLFLMMFGTLGLPDDEFKKLTPEGFSDILSKLKSIPLPKQLEGLNIIESFNTLFANRSTPAWQEVLKKWEEMKEMAAVGREAVKKQVNPAPAVSSTLPPAWNLPSGSAPSTGGGVWEGTKDFVKDHKTEIMIGGAAIVGLYAAYKLFGGKGSSEESKWFSGITDWKVLTVAGLATAFGLYKWGPDVIKNSFEKFIWWFSSEERSSFDAKTIKSLSERIVEYNNANKKWEERRNTFPTELIKSKGGMTWDQFNDNDGLVRNIMYIGNSGVSWIFGNSGVLPGEWKRNWNDYQLLLDYTKENVKKHNIDITKDTKMDDVWKKIMEKEGGK